MKDDGTTGDDTTSDNKWTTQLNFDGTVGTADGRVEFTLATLTGSPAYPANISTDLKLWLRADSSSVAQSGNATSATSWTDIGPYGYVFDRTVSGIGGVDPVWYSSLMNGNPAISFSASDDRLGVKYFNDMPTGDFWITSVYQELNMASTNEHLWTYGSNNSYLRLYPAGYFYTVYGGTYSER